MNWVSIAILSAAIIALVSVLDSHLISRRMPSARAFFLPVAFLQSGFGLIVLAIFPLPSGLEAFPLAVAFASAVIRAVGTYLMISTLRSEEVSRVIPVASTFPIFTAIFAVPLLGEALGCVEWVAIFMTVAGAMLISVRRHPGNGRVGFSRSFFLLLIASFLFGLANIASKYALGYISFWNMYGINGICYGLVFLLVSLRPQTLRELRVMKGRNQALALVLLNDIIAVVGIILSFWAMQQGPVSLVSTVVSVRPAFVFAYALILSRFFPAVLEERLERGVIATKLVSIGLVIGGVVLLTLSG